MKYYSQKRCSLITRKENIHKFSLFFTLQSENCDYFIAYPERTSRLEDKIYRNRVNLKLYLLEVSLPAFHAEALFEEMHLLVSDRIHQR